MPEEKKRMPNEMDEDEEREEERERPEEKAPPKPSGPVGPNVVFNRTARIWVFITAFVVAASVYFIPIPGLNRPIGGLTLGHHHFTFMLLVAAAVFGAGAWAVFTFLGPLLDYQKPGQGRWVRVGGYCGIAFLALFAAVTVHKLPTLRSLWWTPLASWTLLGLPITWRPIFFPATSMFTIAMLAYHLLTNRPHWADFLIETQSELRKVSWPAKREWLGSALVVVIVVAFVSFFVFFADMGLSNLLQKLKIGF